MRKSEHWNEEFKKSILEYAQKPVIIEDDGIIVENYDLTTIILTNEHIKALLDGKALNFDVNGAEYAGLIVLENCLYDSLAKYKSESRMKYLEEKIDKLEIENFRLRNGDKE